MDENTTTVPEVTSQPETPVAPMPEPTPDTAPEVPAETPAPEATPSPVKVNWKKPVAWLLGVVVLAVLAAILLNSM